MNKAKVKDEKKKDGYKGRRGRRDDRPRNRSASPVRVADEGGEKSDNGVVKVTPAKRARTPEEDAPSLFNAKSRKLDESVGDN